MFKQLKLACALAPFAIAALAIQPAAASPVTYTFTGVASGTGTGNVSDFSDANITVTFTGDTADVDLLNDPFYSIHNLTGTLTVGSYSGTLSPTFTVESNSVLNNVDFYNSSFLNGLGFADNALAGYNLTTSIGPITADPANLTPTFGGGDFALDDGSTISFTGNTALTFQAVVQRTTDAPEPITLTLFGAGLAGMGALRRRKNAN